MKKHLWAVCYGLALTAFTSYAALDTFVIRRAYGEQTTSMNLEMFADTEAVPITSADTVTLPEADSSEAEQASEEGSSSEGAEENSASSSESGEKHSKRSRSGQGGGSGRHSKSGDTAGFGGSGDGESGDNGTAAEVVGEVEGGTKTVTDENGNYSITLTEYDEYNTKIYVADVKLSSAQYLKTALADDTYGKNITEYTSSMAGSHGAVLAVNGDYYGVREQGYVIRNGIVYRDTSSGNDMMCVFTDGSMKIINSDDYTADELVSMGVWQALDFGPALIEDGIVTVGTNDEVDRAMADNPRTAIGVIDSNHFIFVVSDGRTEESEGLTLYQLAQFMQRLGVTTAYNLDGGGSSTMYFDGAVVNNPTSGGRIKERAVSDIVYIG